MLGDLIWLLAGRGEGEPMARVCSLMLGAKKAGGSVDGDVVASIAETAEGSALLQLAAHLAALLAAPGPLGVISRGELALMARPRPIRGAEQGELVGTNLKGAGALRGRFALFVGGGHLVAAAIRQASSLLRGSGAMTSNSKVR